LHVRINPKWEEERGVSDRVDGLALEAGRGSAIPGRVEMLSVVPQLDENAGAVPNDRPRIREKVGNEADGDFRPVIFICHSRGACVAQGEKARTPVDVND